MEDLIYVSKTNVKKKLHIIVELRIKINL